MVFACGISSYSITIFHLMNHAFFKALLFLSAGSIIHAMHDEQDMRKMGALNRILPLTYIMTLIGSFALIGFPFLTGYYSKDFILEVACSKYHFSGNLSYWLGTISASFTTFYSFRLVFLTFLNKSNSFKQYILNTHDASIIAAIPLILLAIGSMFIGYITKDMIIGIGSIFWGQSLFILTENISYIEAEYLPYYIKLIPFIFSHFGILFAYHISFFLSNNYIVYEVNKTNEVHNFVKIKKIENRAADRTKEKITQKSTESIKTNIWEQQSFQKNLILHKLTTTPQIIKLYIFFNQKWHVDDFYNRFIVQQVITFGYNISFRLFDAGWIAYLGPNGISNTIQYLAHKFNQLQTGYVYHYAFIILITITLLITILLSWNLIPLWEETALYFISIITFFYLTSTS